MASKMLKAFGLFELLTLVTAINDPCSMYANESGNITVLLPGPDDSDQFCYQCPNLEYAECNLAQDPLCSEHTLASGTCEEFGYKFYVKNDPVFVESGLYLSGKQSVEK